MIEKFEINTITSWRKRRILGISYGEVVEFEKILWIDAVVNGEELTLVSKSFKLSSIWDRQCVTGKVQKYAEELWYIHGKLLSRLEGDATRMVYLMYTPFNYGTLKSLIATYGHSETSLRKLIKYLESSGLDINIRRNQRIERLGFRL